MMVYVKEAEVIVGARFDYLGHKVECVSPPRKVPGGVVADFLVIESDYLKNCTFSENIANLTHLSK